MTTKAELLEQKDQLDRYLTSKHKAGDYHAVQDAASDIRELLAKLELLNEEPTFADEERRAYLELGLKPNHLPHQHEYKFNIRDDRFHCECGDSYPSSEQLTRPVQTR